MRLTELVRSEIHETFWSGRHESGFEVLLHPKRGFAHKVAVLGVRCGSLDAFHCDPESGGGPRQLPEGAAHFLEHELFRKKGGDIAERFARTGATVNASTGLVATTYDFSCTRALQANLSLLFELVFEPHFDAGAVKREQGIIREEIRMYQDDPDWRVFRNLLGSLYHRHPIRGDIAGTEESLAEITPQVLEAAYRSFYRPSNAFLVVSGDIDPQATADHVERLLGRMGSCAASAAPSGTASGTTSGTASDAAPELARVPPREPRRIVRRAICDLDDVALPKLLLGFKDPEPPADGPATLEREVHMNLLLHLVFGGGSRCYQDLYDRGLVDDSFHASYTANAGAALTVVGGDTDDPEGLHEEIRRILRTVRSDGVRAADFRRTCRKVLGRFFFAFDSPASTAATLASFRSKGCQAWDLPRIVSRTRPSDIGPDLLDRLQTRYSAASLLLPRHAAPAGLEAFR